MKVSSLHIDFLVAYFITRKVVEKGNITEIRYYIGGYEVFRKTNNGSLDFERKTLNISDDEKVFVRVEQKTGENEIIRYQYDNHLGSACLELDDTGQIISYEEYHPFGTTSYRSGRTEIEVSLKRYKYNGKERDEETGLYAYGMRYYAAWLCRFVSVDPLQFEYPHYTPYQYAGNKPISYIDLDGAEERKATTYDPATDTVEPLPMDAIKSQSPPIVPDIKIPIVRIVSIQGTLKSTTQATSEREFNNAMSTEMGRNLLSSPVWKSIGAGMAVTTVVMIGEAAVTVTPEVVTNYGIPFVMKATQVAAQNAPLLETITGGAAGVTMSLLVGPMQDIPSVQTGLQSFDNSYQFWNTITTLGSPVVDKITDTKSTTNPTNQTEK